MCRITKDEIKGRYSKQKMLDIYEKVKTQGNIADFVRSYMYDEEDFVARNALGSVTKATKSELQQLKPMLNELIDRAMQTDNSSIRRMLLCIIDRIDISINDLRTDWLNFCLDNMTDPRQSPAIQALCMKHAWRMCRFYPELMGEMQRIIEDLETDYYTPATKSVIRHIMREQRRKRQDL